MMTYFTDVSYDHKYVVSGGYITWASEKFLPASDYLELDCYPSVCGSGSNDPKYENNLTRGTFHFFVDSHFEFTKLCAWVRAPLALSCEDC